MAIYTFERKQVLATTPERLWMYITDPWNLAAITPDYMGFEVLSKGLPAHVYPGLMISYKVRPLLGLPLSWLTEITHVRELQYFVDEQRKGPYRLWHHEHHILACEEGVEMYDRITYAPPLGFLGDIANVLLIERQLKDIFDYRKVKLAELFGETDEC